MPGHHPTMSTLVRLRPGRSTVTLTQEASLALRHWTTRLFLSLLRPRRYRAFQDYLRSQWLPAEVLESERRGRLRRLLEHAVTRVPYYRDHPKLAPRPGEDVAAWLARFPLVDKKQMMAARERFVTEGAGPDILLPNNTGGSTGTWFKFFNDRRTNHLRHAIDMLGRTWGGWHPGDHQAMLWGHRGDVKQQATLSGRVANRLVIHSVVLNAYNMDDEAMALYIRRLAEWRPVLIIGYASALAFLADAIQRHGHRPPRGLRSVIASAETLTDEQRETITAGLGCPVLNRYGSREFGVIAQQCRADSGLHVMIQRVWLEVITPDGRPAAPGERGEIVVTDLDNLAMPFIRYRTGDLAVPAAGACNCGRQLPLLATVEGRVSELIVGPNGKYYSCQSPRLFGADIAGIGQMQVIQETLHDIEIKVVPAPGWGEESRRQLVERMCGLLGEVNVTVTVVPAIPLAPSGKYRFTISKVSPFARE